ncbi:hypothetical protein LSM04_008547 [Trypanosoma melophagium]|uniref:uncharacterized protein n=1 Tax=Trypanosoma melophagium TaxID=715481 RepID=UPI003519F71B|nr:hypothetical protein LSM04_008547 [Trypanosoma melophagium]
MISPKLLWYRAKKQRQHGEDDGDLIQHVQWLSALRRYPCRTNRSSSITKTDKNNEDIKKENKLIIHAAHSRRLYLHYARELSEFSDAHDYYRLMMWCHDQHVFIHPAVRMHRRPSMYRDHVFTVSRDIDRLTPLIAIPESLVIGFKDMTNLDDSENSLRDEKKEKEFNELNLGGQSDADVCQFFFASLGMIVSDLVTAKSSPLTDPRSVFAELLGKVRTLKNAPYFEDDVILDTETTGLADVLLQMIRNYIHGGPLVGKLDRTELRWAVSVCLSHSTPLVIASARSIGVIPLIHLFPHGGKDTNAFVVARTSHTASAKRIAAYFNKHHGYDFMHDKDGKWIYVVPSVPLHAADEIRLQAMAPVCGKDSEAEKMWQLSCAVAPEEYMTTAAVSHMQRLLTRELMDKGGDILAEIHVSQ